MAPHPADGPRRHTPDRTVFPLEVAGRAHPRDGRRPPSVKVILRPEAQLLLYPGAAHSQILGELIDHGAAGAHLDAGDTSEEFERSGRKAHRSERPI